MKALRLAEQTRVLRGHRVRTIDSRVLALAFAVELVGGALASASLGRSIALGVAALILSVVLQVVALQRWWSRGVRANNDGVEALSLDRFDDAEAGFRRLVTVRHPRTFTALGLQNLATVALRRGELADGAVLSRAALELLTRARTGPSAELFSGHIRANYAFALLANGEVDEAEAVLRPPPEPGALAKSEALLVRARALALVRRERWQDVADLLDQERSLLRNTLTGDEAVLAEVMGALARHRLDRPGPLVAVDDDERAFVTRILPGCEGVLVRT